MEPVGPKGPRQFQLAWVFILLAVLPFSAWAVDESLEYQVKAAFLLNFTKFVEWPASAFQAAESPMTICILGDDPFGTALDQIVVGEVVDGHRVVVERIAHAPAPKVCQVLFVSGPEKTVPSVLAGLGPAVLTVGEGELFTRSGGMIAFMIDSRRVRFSVNQTAAENAGLKLSSKLLSIAISVKR